MSRCIGIMVDGSDNVTGFLIHNEKKGLFSGVTYHFARLMLQSGIDLTNLYLENDRIRCKDCALSKMPKYLQNGSAIKRNQIMLVADKMSASSDSYIVYVNVDYSTVQTSNGDFALYKPKSNNVKVMNKSVLINALHANPDAVCNMYITKSGVLRQKSN